MHKPCAQRTAAEGMGAVSEGSRVLSSCINLHCSTCWQAGCLLASGQCQRRMMLQQQQQATANGADEKGACSSASIWLCVNPISSLAAGAVG